MSAAAVLAALATAVAVLLAFVLLRNRARLSELEAMQRVGPMTLSHPGEPTPTTRVIRDGWSQVFQQMIYSASDVAREEFPDHDLTVRGAVSIGRRLMDPLAEHHAPRRPVVSTRRPVAGTTTLPLMSREIVEQFFHRLGSGNDVDGWLQLLDPAITVDTPFSPKGDATRFE